MFATKIYFSASPCCYPSISIYFTLTGVFIQLNLLIKETKFIIKKYYAFMYSTCNYLLMKNVKVSKLYKYF